MPLYSLQERLKIQARANCEGPPFCFEGQNREKKSLKFAMAVGVLTLTSWGLRSRVKWKNWRRNSLAKQCFFFCQVTYDAQTSSVSSLNNRNALWRQRHCTVQIQVRTTDAGELIFQQLLTLWLLIVEGWFTFEHSHKTDFSIILMGTLQCNESSSTGWFISQGNLRQQTWSKVAQTKMKYPPLSHLLVSASA